MVVGAGTTSRAPSQDPLLRACPELAPAMGSALAAAALRLPDAESRAQARSELAGWHRSLHEEARTSAEQREVQLLQDFIALTDQLAALETDGARDPDALRHLCDLLLQQRAHGAKPWLEVLQQIPRSLEAFRRLTMAPHPILLDDARVAAQQWPDALQAMLVAQRETTDPALLSELEQAVQGCAGAVAAQASWLAGLEARPGVASEASLDHLAQLRHIPYAVSELVELLHSEEHEWTVECARLARRLQPGAPVEQVLADVRRTQPASRQAGWADLRSALSGVHAHCEERRLFVDARTRPAIELEILPTAIARALDVTGPRVRVRAQGTPVLQVGDPGDAAPLAGLAASELSNLVARTGMPGTSALLLSARAHGAQVRGGLALEAWPWGFTGWAADLRGGWPLYVVEMLREEGWEGSVQHALLLAEQARADVAAARIELDLARGTLDGAQAAARAVVEVRLGQDEARRQVVHWVRRPGAQVSAVVGALRLFELRRDCKQDWGVEYSLERFHQAVLAAGLVPLDEVASWLRETSPRESS